MAWIELQQNMPGHRKTRRVKSRLGISTPAAVGHLCLLWLWALDSAENGSLGGMLNREIADVCEYEGDADEFVDALVEAGYLDRTEDDLVIHDWGERYARYMDTKEKNRIRQQRYRERQRVQQGEAADAGLPIPPPPAVQQDPELAKAMSFYLDRVNPTASQTSIGELEGFVKDMGADVCIKAMEYALDEHKATWSYIRGTLRGFRKRGIKNMNDLRREQEAFERRKMEREDTQRNASTRRNFERGTKPPAAAGPPADPLKGFHTED